MLKKRIIAVLPIKNGIVVQSIGFQRYLPVGKPRIAVEFLNSWGVDEIILLDLDATAEKRCIPFQLVHEVSKFTQVPLTVGGGVKNIDQMKALLGAGADKISLNEAAFTFPSLITQGAEIFGSQCIIVSLDVKISPSGLAEIFRSSGKIPTGLSLISFAKKVEKLGAGGILFNSIDRDGSKKGYDLKTSQTLAESIDIPVIICGGVGCAQHMVDGLKVPNISGVAAGNFFHFQEHSVTVAKRFILNAFAKSNQNMIRLDTYNQYKENYFDDGGRLLKKNETELEMLFFEFHPKEVI